MEREPLSGPPGPRRIARLCFLDGLDERPCMRADSAIARLADRRMALVRLLHERAQKTRELGELSRCHPPSKLDIGEETIAGVALLPEARCFKKTARRLIPIRDRRKRRRLFIREMMKERTLAHACFATEVIDRRRGIALGAKELERRVEKTGARIAGSGSVRGPSHIVIMIPISRYVNPGRGFFALARFEVAVLHSEPQAWTPRKRLTPNAHRAATRAAMRHAW